MHAAATAAGGGQGPPSSAPAAVGYAFSMDKYSVTDADKRESPAAERNKAHILEVLLYHLPALPPLSALSQLPAAASTTAAAEPEPPGGDAPQPVPHLILEVASGSGQHAAHFAPALPGYLLQPSDATPELFASIIAYCRQLPNVQLPPLVLDMTQPGWHQALRGQPCAAVVCINMCHISPVEATRGLLKGAGAALAPDSGRLFIYGPFMRDGKHTTDSNAAFDASLRARNPAWGYRDVRDVADWAAAEGLQLMEVRDMPANNFMLVFRRA